MGRVGSVLLGGLMVLSMMFAGTGAAVATGSSTPPPPAAPDAIDLANDAALPSGVGSAQFKPRKWPGKTIKYWTDAPDAYVWTIKAAIESWNKTGLDMTIKLVKSRAKSNATIRVSKQLPPISGLATVGYNRGKNNNWIKLSPRSILKTGPGHSYYRVVMAHIVAHEIGHNLGLMHNEKSKCALMAPILDGGSCPLLDEDRPGYYACKIVDKAAVVPMVRKYGGKKTVNAGKDCLLDPLPPTTDFTWSGGEDEGGPITVTWTPPSKAPKGTKVDIVYNDTCDFPIRRNLYGFPVSLDERQARVPIAAGSWTQPAHDVLGLGCYGAQAVNVSGAGREPTTATLTSYEE